VQELTETGEFLHAFGSQGALKGRFKFPMGIVADEEGHVWVAGVGNQPAEPEPELSEEDAAPLPRVGIVAAYSFDEDTGRTLHDDSGNEHDGKIEGAQWAEGKFGSALKFNWEGGDCVTIPDSPELQLTEEFTLEAWVRPEGKELTPCSSRKLNTSSAMACIAVSAPTSTPKA
jgi:hypothetical protein